MKPLTEQIKQALSALAHADAAEMLSGADKYEALGYGGETSVPPQPVLSPVKARKQVALSLGGNLPRGVMNYVTGVCQRLGADLAILSNGATDPDGLLRPYRKELKAAAIELDVTLLSGNVERALVRHLTDNPQILFLVYGGVDDPVQGLVESGAWRRSGAAALVPVVVVAPEPAIPGPREANTASSRSSAEDSGADAAYAFSLLTQKGVRHV